MATPFTVYNGSNNTSLANSLLAPNSGITISSVVLNASAPDAVNLYDGSLTALGIGAGLLLTTGTTPGTSNTMGWFGQGNGGAGDADINAVVNTVFQTQSYDATTLAFDFSVADPNATSISFDIVFGSDEYPEWVDQFVDSAVVIVNGVNYALFNHDPNHPLSVISSNLAAGYFQDNTGNVLPIEYDGVSHVLKIVAPINAGGATNHIKIGIADTGDGIYDSGIFLANFSAGTIPGSGVVSAPITGTVGSDTLTGTMMDEYFDLKAGDDIVFAGAGDDIVVAGSGNDSVYGGSGADQMKGDTGIDFFDGGSEIDTAVYAGTKADYDIAFNSTSGEYTITAKANGSASADGVDTLLNVEFAKFGDSTWSLGTNGVATLVDTGTPIVIPVNQVGTLLISGIAGQGQTLTANVSDTNGVPTTGISYAWQANGVDLGVSGNTFLVGAAQVGQNITATAFYTDLAGYSESLTSAVKTISAPGNGDFTITLLNLSAPVGASVMNPLTTLINDAINLGVSPNEASLIIKSALGVSSNINLQHYDSWAILQSNPLDKTALSVEKVAVQVAVMTSLGSDETGMALTQAILLAHSNNTTLNLTDKTVIANILGLTPTDPLVLEIWDRNDTIGAAKNVASIENIWADMQSGLSIVLSDSIGTLSVHINQDPIGSATVSLANGVENTDYIISVSDLLTGFSDTDGGTLSVSGLTASNGATVTPNNDGTFTITSPENYIGPVELTYTVLDGQGGSATANQLFGIVSNQVTPVNSAPTGAATVILTDGIEDTAYIVSAADLLAGFNDVDGDVLSVSGLIASNGTVVDNGDGTFTITPTLDFNGTVILSYDVIDGNGGSVTATQDYTLAAVNDAPTGSAIAALAAGTEDTAYTVSVADLLAGFSDVDGDTLSVSGLTASNGTVVDNGDGTFTITPSLNYNGAVTLDYNVIDGHGGSIAATQGYTLAAVNDAPQLTGVAATLVAGFENAAYTLSTVDLLAGYSDVEGDVLSVNSLVADNGTVTDNGDGTWTIVPTTDYYGPVHLNYNVIDGNGGNGGIVPVAQAFNLQPTSINIAPVIISSTVNAATVSTTTVNYSGTLAFTDANVGDTHSSAPALAVGAAGGSLSTNVTESSGSGTVAWSYAYTLPTTFGKTVLTKTDSFDVSIDDGYGGVTSQNISVNVTTGTSAVNTLTGNAGIDILLGAGGNDILNGGSGNDVLDGGTGNDILSGGLGDDTYIVDSASDVITENLDEGTDQVISKVTYTLAANVENLVLTGTGTINGTGNSSANIISGGIGNNILDGLAGADIMMGGLGNDTYMVDDAGDVVIEALGAGTDLVKSSLTFDLNTVANVENLTLLGTANINAIGDAGANTLTGNTGNNVLIGGAGVDKLVGGGGNDTYVVNITATGTLEDSITANTGIDTVQVQGGYSGAVKTLTAAATIENYDISGTGSSLLNLTGNVSNNVLTGNDANNLINGGTGSDSMAGGLGDDTYTVDNVADSIIENASAGVDLVNSSVSFDLSSNGINVEKLTLNGTGVINATGNNSDNLITGNSVINTLLGYDGNDSLYGLAGNDVIDGGNGNDLLIGGAGNDALTGGTGADIFWSNTALSATSNLDSISDFVSGVDVLQFSASVLTKLGLTGQFSDSDARFWSNTTGAAHDADDRLIYNSTTGELFYDSNGSATGGSVLVEVLATAPTLAATDIWVV